MHHRSMSQSKRRRLMIRAAVAAGVGVAGGALAISAMAQASPAGSGLRVQQAASVGNIAQDSQQNRLPRTFDFRTIDDQKDPTFNQLLGINEHGKIVGYFGSGADAAHPNKGYRLIKPYGQQNFINENVPGSAQTQVIGINNGSTTVGFYVNNVGANKGFIRSPEGVFTKIVNPLTTSASPGTAVNQLLGVNDHRVAVGFYNDAAGNSHGYTYDIRRHSFHPVVLPVQADSVTATSINDEGDVAGFYVSGGVTRGFLLEHGYFEHFRFGGGSNTQVLGVNDRDQVVGSYVDAGGLTHGFLWGHGTLRTINDPQASPTKGAGTIVNGLNDDDQLVGFYVDAAGNTNGLVASPNGRY